ncbi:Acetyl-coenzyme A carboxylase carboxyl transferase subunit alpha [uncultured Clostridium sp.]|nr:Acetyl-coenzyme A carboxylase carboxyl transferase subunit alpha [uncultured Clostridium sp.]
MSKKVKAWSRVEIARMIQRPTTLQYIDKIFEDFIELHGDRGYKDDKAIVAGIALLEGEPVTIIGMQKGKDLNENIERNFGSPHPEGYRKALRFMKQAEKFNRPIICFINTAGAYCGVEAEKRGQGEAIARNLMEISTIKVPIISIIIGEGGSGGALALAVGDRVWMLENSIYSILSPEGFASILLKDPTKSKEVAETMGITSYELLDRNIIEKVIKEPKGGAHNDLETVAQNIKEEIIKELYILKKKNVDILLEERYKRFRSFS